MLAEVLLERSWSVAVTARRVERLEALAARAATTAPDARVAVIPADLADPDAAARIVDDAWRALGAVDVLVNNAATPGVRDVHALDAETVEAVMNVNFHAAVRTTLAALPRMEARGTGTIVNVSSLGGRLGIRREAAYCASKFALCGWTESLALDLWTSPVAVKLVIPGPVDTEIWEQGDEHPSYDGPKVPARDVATAIADAIDSDRFEHYIPDMKAIAEYKTAKIDRYLEQSIAALG
jgi:short-subunit dehydrogenase